ncbi:MAG TPA: hypothetical protein VIH83_05570 [Candidatus Bathyarchaeia archaeon]
MAEDEGRVFKPRPGHLYPVILSLAITGLLGIPFAVSDVEVISVTPFQGDTYSGASLNALFFVIALASSATIMFLLVRRGKMGFLRGMIKAALVVVCFSVVFWYSTILFFLLGSPLGEPAASTFLLAVSLGVGLGFALLVFGKGSTRQLVGVVLVSGFTGLFLGASIPLLTALILAGALVVYDVVAVFRGPVGALAKSLEMGDLPGAVFNYKELTIGMGDMVFYSLVATTALLNFGVFPFFATGVGIIAGTFLGFKALQKFEMFPGLPFSLILGVAGMLLAAWL